MDENQASSAVFECSAPYMSSESNLCKGYDTNQDQHIRTRNSKWTDKTIRKAIERFIDENGRPPKVKELDQYDWLPPHPSIKNRYKVCAGKWLLENYPPAKVNWKNSYKHYTPDDFRAIFVSEYQRIEPTSKLMYNKERNPMTPSWQYIAKMLGVDTWVKLKTICGVNHPNKRKGERSFVVTSQILGISEDLKKRSPYKRNPDVIVSDETVDVNCATGRCWK